MTNTPKEKTPSEIAKELWISNSYCHCMDSAPCSTDKPCDYCLTIIAEIEATIAAERQNVYLWKRSAEDLQRKNTMLAEQVASLEAELAETNKLRTESRSREATHLGKIASLEQELAEAKRLLQIETQMVNSLHNYDGDAANLLRRYDIDNRSLTAENERLRAVINRWLTRVEYDWNTQFREALGSPLHQDGKVTPEFKAEVDKVIKHCDHILSRSGMDDEAPGDSAGPEKEESVIKNMVNAQRRADEWLADDPIRKAEHAVIEAARNMMKVDPSLLNDSLGSAYAIKHYCEVRQALEALERAKGKEDGHDGR